jgi:hypothetical protein
MAAWAVADVLGVTIDWVLAGQDEAVTAPAPGRRDGPADGGV